MTQFTTIREQLLVRRVSQARERQPEGATLRDPIEDDPLYSALFEHAEYTAQHGPDGPWTVTCHERWARLKKVLLEEYGVIWFSPDEMNPFTLFD